MMYTAYTDIRAGYLAVFVLPIIIYYLFKFKGKAFIIYAILSLAFTAGSIELLTGFSTNHSLRICELLIWGLTVYTLLTTPELKIPYWRYIFGFLLICSISYIINPVSFIQLLLFLRRYLLFVATVVFFHNVNLRNNDREKLLKFIILLFVSQIIVNIVRYPMIGQTEGYIGTMETVNGSITAIFTLVGVSFSFSAYLYKRRLIFIILIFGFFIFSVIGMKRGHLFFLPFLISIQYLVYLRYTQKNFWFNALRAIPSTLIIIVVIIYGGVILVPTLNPENAVGGSFDPAYIVEYLYRYTSPNRPIKAIEYYGRGEAPYAVYNLLVNNGFIAILFGLGPGDIILSQYNIPSSPYFSEDMITGIKYGIGYGARTGVLFTTMQVGLLGMLFYFIYIYKEFSLFLKSRYYEKGIPVKNQIITLSLVGFLGIFIFDFFAYSRVSFQIIPILMPICFACYYSTSVARLFYRNL